MYSPSWALILIHAPLLSASYDRKGLCDPRGRILTINVFNSHLLSRESLLQSHTPWLDPPFPKIKLQHLVSIHLTRDISIPFDCGAIILGFRSRPIPLHTVSASILWLSRPSSSQRDIWKAWSSVRLFGCDPLDFEPSSIPITCYSCYPFLDYGPSAFTRIKFDSSRRAWSSWVKWIKQWSRKTWKSPNFQWSSIDMSWNPPPMDPDVSVEHLFLTISIPTRSTIPIGKFEVQHLRDG